MLNVDISVHYLMSKLSNVKRKHGKLNKYGATLTLLRAGIAEGCVFLKCHVGGLSVCRCKCDP